MHDTRLDLGLLTRVISPVLPVQVTDLLQSARNCCKVITRYLNGQPDCFDHYDEDEQGMFWRDTVSTSVIGSPCT